MLIFHSYVGLPEGIFNGNFRILNEGTVPYKLNYLSKMLIFHSYVGLPEGIFNGNFRILNEGTVPYKLNYLSKMLIFHSYVGLPEGIFNGNFRILKWRYCTVLYKTIFCGDIHLHRPEQ